jgi:FAD:protein FMN transferase
MRCWLLNLILLPTVATGTQPAVFQHENVLGTSLELRVLAESDVVAVRAEAVVLAEIDRLAAVFSTYNADSEFSRWWQAGQPAMLSPELSAVLAACDRWQQLSGGAFHPGAELVTRLWQQAEPSGTVPTEIARRDAVAVLKHRPWEWQPDGTVRPAGRYPVSLNALAKGAILDAACRRLLEVPGVSGGLVKIGGDLRVSGEFTATVAINGPDGSVLPTSVLDEIVTRDRAVATSSGAFRGVTLGARRWSHLVDPRTGSPVDHIQSATVLAPSAADADALATACSVLTVAESLALIDSLPEVACLLLDADGRLHRSRRWPLLPEAIAVAAEPAPVWNGGMELEVAFEINQPDAGGRYRRPYVAVWVEDADGQPVRTLVLWVQTSGPGPKWIPDLKRWYRGERARKAAQGTDLIRTVSEATRKPGEYAVVWDGRTDAGDLVPPGDYTLSLEAMREHGTYQLIRKTISCRDQPVRVTLEGNEELKSATLEYRKRRTAARSS